MEATFSLHLSRDQVMTYYRGQTRFIQVRDDQGRNLRFPLANLRPFVTADGIHGRFRIRFDANHRLTELTALE